MSNELLPENAGSTNSNAVVDIAYYPPMVGKDISLSETGGKFGKKISMSEVGSFGAFFTEAIKAIPLEHSAGQGLYRVTFKQGVHGSLARFHDGSGYLGAIFDKPGHIAGQARLNKVNFNPAAVNPTVMLVTVTMASMSKQLDEIEEKQQGILDFLIQDKEAKLRGDLDTLNDVMNNLKFNSENENWIRLKLNLIQEIKRDSKNNIGFYEERVKAIVDKDDLIHLDTRNKERLTTLLKEFKNYQTAQYLYAFSAFLEVMLLGNFDTDYLSNCSNKIRKYEQSYHELYLQSQEKFTEYVKGSVKHRIMGGVARVSKFAGGTIAKIPRISNGQVDENLIAAGEHIDDLGEGSVKKMTEKLSAAEDGGIGVFADNIMMLDRIGNKPVAFLTDGKDLFIEG